MYPRFIDDDAEAEGERPEVGRYDPREDHDYGGRDDIGGLGFLREKERDRDNRREDRNECAKNEGHELGGAAVAQDVARGGFLDVGVSHSFSSVFSRAFTYRRMTDLGRVL